MSLNLALEPGDSGQHTLNEGDDVGEQPKESQGSYDDVDTEPCSCKKHPNEQEQS